MTPAPAGHPRATDDLPGWVTSTWLTTLLLGIVWSFAFGPLSGAAGLVFLLGSPVMSVLVLAICSRSMSSRPA